MNNHEQVHEVVRIVFGQIKSLTRNELEDYYNQLIDYSSALINNLTALRKFINKSNKKI